MMNLLDEERRNLREDQRNFLSSRLTPLRKTILKWEYGENEPYDAWIFAEFGVRATVAAYCCGGFGALGSPWGIISADSAWFGQDPGWYPNLSELLDDGWVPGDT